MAFNLQAALAQIQADPIHSGFGNGWEEGSGENATYHSSVPIERTGGYYFYGGKAIKPNGDGTYLVYTPADPGHASRLNGTTADVMDASGNVVGQQRLEGISDNNAGQQFLTGAAMLAAPIAMQAMGVGAGAGVGATGGGAGAAGVSGLGDLGAFGGAFDGLAATAASAPAGLPGMGGFIAGTDAAIGNAALAFGGGAAGAAGGFAGDPTAGGYGGLDSASTASMAGGAPVAGGGGSGFVTPTAPGLGQPATIASRLGDAASSLGLGGGAVGAGGFNWGSLIGPALSAVGGIAGAKAADSAADAQLQATRDAAALQEPFRQGGMAAMNRLLELNGIGGNPASEGYGSAQRDFTAADFAAGMDPGYEWRKQQGQLGLERAASAKGGLGSGGYLKDAMTYNSGLASQEFGNAYNRFQTNRAARLNPLQSLMGAGQTAANTIGGLTVSGGEASAAGTMGKANALTSALGQGFSMYQNNQNRLYEQGLADRYLQSRGF